MKGKKISMVFILIMIMILIAGCYEASLELDFDEEGSMKIESEIIGGTYATRDDMNKAFWQLKIIFPELDLNYYTRREGKNFRFIRHDPISHQEINIIEWQEEDGTYTFEMEIPAIYGEEEDSDDLFLDIVVIMPADIDMANTTNVEDNRARWSIRERDLHKDITLRAFTE